MEESEDTIRDFHALETVIRALTPLTEEARTRVLTSAATFLKIPQHSAAAPSTGGISSFIAGSILGNSSLTKGSDFTEDRSITPKQFLFDKRPQSMVERIACLAYYLTHYRNQPHFQNVDISAINTEAAQPKLVNPARDISNAQSTGYLVAASKGNRQLSANGEAFVLALPDREAAKQAMIIARPRKKARRKTGSVGTDGASDSE